MGELIFVLVVCFWSFVGYLVDRWLSRARPGVGS